MHYVTHVVHCIALHCIALDYIPFHCIALLQYVALHCITWHYIALHYTALHCIALHCTTLHCTILIYFTSPYIACMHTYGIIHRYCKCKRLKLKSMCTCRRDMQRCILACGTVVTAHAFEQPTNNRPK